MKVKTERQLLFSVTRKDLDVQTFRAGGKGGQNQNKVESGVRIVHRESGAVGEARDSRDQHRNKKAAFERMVNSAKFKAWHKLKCAALMGRMSVDNLVDAALDPKNLKIEIGDGMGNWTHQEENDE